MRISDWSSDVCSSDLSCGRTIGAGVAGPCPPSSQPVDKFGSPGIRGGTESAAPGMEFGCRVCPTDRTGVVEGKSVSVRVDLGGRRLIKKIRHTTRITLDQRTHINQMRYREVKQ